MPKILASVPSAQLWIVGCDWPDLATGRPFADTLRICIFSLVPKKGKTRIPAVLGAIFMGYEIHITVH